MTIPKMQMMMIREHTEGLYSIVRSIKETRKGFLPAVQCPALWGRASGCNLITAAHCQSRTGVEVEACRKGQRINGREYSGGRHVGSSKSDSQQHVNVRM